MILLCTVKTYESLQKYIKIYKMYEKFNLKKKQILSKYFKGF